MIVFLYEMLFLHNDNMILEWFSTETAYFLGLTFSGIVQSRRI